MATLDLDDIDEPQFTILSDEQLHQLIDEPDSPTLTNITSPLNTNNLLNTTNTTSANNGTDTNTKGTDTNGTDKPKPNQKHELSPAAAIELLDSTWYAMVSRKSRWMDLIGDYAGNENFVVDGESLLQQVLNDPLLALGKPGDPSFQILHAKHTLEKMLERLRLRSSEFHVVFWEDSRHLTLQTGCPSPYVSTSRTLARSILFQHLHLLPIPVYSFKSLDDPNWRQYIRLNRPMFILMNDGGVADTHKIDAAECSRIVLQRTAVFRFITTGLAVAILSTSEYRDNKVLAFVLESRLNPQARALFPEAFWRTQANIQERLDGMVAVRPLPSLPAQLSSSPNQQQQSSHQQEVAERLGKLYFKESQQSSADLPLLKAFIAHLILLDSLSVTDRALSLAQAPLHPELNKLVVEEFLLKIFGLLNIVAGELGVVCSVDIDTRVFVCLLYVITSHPDSSLEAVVGTAVAERVEGVWASAGMGKEKVDMKAFAKRYPAPKTTTKKDSEQRVVLAQRKKGPEAYAVLPFSNEIFDEQLASVHVRVFNETSPSPSSPPSGTANNAKSTPDSAHFSFNANGTVFADTIHWHVKKPLLPKYLGGGDLARPAAEREAMKAGGSIKDEKARQKQMKRDQRFMAQMLKQAVSLTGALGAPIERQTIVPVGVSVLRARDVKKVEARKKVEGKKAEKGEKSAAHSSKGGKKPVVETKADQIRKQNEARLRQKETDESAKWWKERLKELDTIPSVQARATKVEDLYRNARCKEGWLALEVRMYRMHLEFLRWIEDGERETGAAKDAYAVAIMRMVRHFYSRKRISQGAVECLGIVLTVLGFSAYLSTLPSTSSSSSSSKSSSGLVIDPALDHPLSFSFVKLIDRKTKAVMHKFMEITEDPIVWQLRVFGEFMDRSMDSKEDARVRFEPDGWQREVLDCVDSGKSLLVVAPTSAGKTFISFYAMEQILRGSDDGMLIYVAPTKALVNQIAAEISARFSKDVAGKSCWAVHTRDYRIHDPQKCQILVTVPEMLAIMLMSPPLARSWTPRIKRIILDEIHSIGQQEGGAVWEQILLLAPCPIIGLSATIGQPEIFNNWLASVQKAHNFEHAFIHHPHRYSHLRKFVYLIPDTPQKFSSLSAHKVSTRMRFLHPMSMLAFGAPSLPPDLSLESRDTLTLYNAMLSIKDSIKSDLGKLEPTKFFTKKDFLKQKDVLEYEAALKEVVAGLISSPESRDANSALDSIVKTLQDPVLKTKTEDQLNSTPNPTTFIDGLMPFLCDLHAQKDLPAVCFAFDRAHVELMAKTVFDALVESEARWRENSTEYKRKFEEWENWQKVVAAQKAAAEKAKKQTKDEMAREAADAPRASAFDPEDPSDGFTFADSYKYSKEEVQEDLWEIRWTSVPDWLKRALRRGIGVHHSGMNKAYRSLVERLFRLGYLRVVFATGTLALGINAPARTSVFCGDSPFLTSLMYRQCAGRAGRRGFDLLGKVVFYGLPLDRVQRLILSKLPVLTGNFPLSSTLCLRLFNLLHGSENAPIAVEAVRSIMRLPHISFGSDVGREQLLHHVRFSIEYLRRSGLLDGDGQPMNLFGIAAHLYYTEPSNFALVALMRAGVLHEICNQTSLIKAKEDFVLLVSHLFGRRYVPSAYSKDSVLQSIRRKYPSKIVLPPLPENARRVLTRHNEEILRIFTGYASIYCDQYADALGLDDALPLSSMRVGNKSAERQASLLQEELNKVTMPVSTRSPFVANSGHSDDFESVEELSQTCRRGVNLNEHAIPSLHHIVADDTPALNAFILDFFTHGQINSLIVANGIRRGDVWFLLQDFSLTIMSIRTTLENLLTKASSAVQAEAADDETEVDSGYFSADVTEIDADEDRIGTSTFKRPAKVSDKDWRVYEVVDSVLKEFNEQFKKMWA